MTKYCPKCGAPNPDDARFCMKCGFDFSTLQQTQPANQPVQFNQPFNQPMPSNQPPTINVQKFNEISPKLLLPGGLLYSIAIILISIGFILSFSISLIKIGGKSAAVGGVSLGDYIIYLLIGLFLLMSSIKRSISGGVIFILSILGFLYMILLGVFNFIEGSSAIGAGVEAVIAAVFLLVSMFLFRSNSLYTSYTGITFGLVAGILYFISISSTYGGANRFAGLLSANSYYYLGFVSMILFVITLYIKPFSRYQIISIINKLLLNITSLLFSIGVLVLGAVVISSGVPSTTGLPGYVAGGAYTLFAAGAIDIPAGILLLVTSIFILLTTIVELGRKITKPYSPAGQ
ncbi:zinc-ribbon domain-containing protein [Acidianus manzaensis]|uniref:Zinc-ribbon domain-containing protein n=1 Tax=Acidianus manzaensis TaxID=282676 RepID=A0A1W6K362_9CREN|nr:zinc ribbon domain-containing protein [Acidianus manzaensis]ARM76969.1 hypothetical protein B6F84_13710 [Acidianus manzaensis]